VSSSRGPPTAQRVYSAWSISTFRTGGLARRNGAMDAALTVLGSAALVLVSVAVILALVILVLHEARYVIRLGLRLRMWITRLQNQESNGEPF
jgi:hypothetical protein